MNKTSIEWVRNPDGSQGYTFNPITGCLNHDNGLCKGGGFPCYAYRLAHGRLKQRYVTNDNLSPYTHEYFRPSASGGKDSPYADPFYPRFWEERLGAIPTPWQTLAGMQAVKPRGIFVCDMADLFGIGVPEEWTQRIMTTIRDCPQHRFYTLTKQPQNLIKFSPFPANCYVGVTYCGAGLAKEGKTEKGFTAIHAHMSEIEAKVKFISLEPLLSSCTPVVESYGLDIFDWLIIGAQTKPYKPPKIEWVREIVEAADKAGIPVFLKDNLAPILPIGEGWCDFGAHEGGEGAIMRQEMPYK